MTERRINAGILGTGHYLPPRILTNDELAQRVARIGCAHERLAHEKRLVAGLPESPDVAARAQAALCHRHDACGDGRGEVQRRAGRHGERPEVAVVHADQP